MKDNFQDELNYIINNIIYFTIIFIININYINIA